MLILLFLSYYLPRCWCCLPRYLGVTNDNIPSHHAMLCGWFGFKHFRVKGLHL
jgi:hypothetical protein